MVSNSSSNISNKTTRITIFITNNQQMCLWISNRIHNNSKDNNYNNSSFNAIHINNSISNHMIININSNSSNNHLNWSLNSNSHNLNKLLV